MRKTLICAAIVSLLQTNVFADQMADQSMQAKGLIKEFGGSLKGELQAAMKAGGPVNAIEVCNTKAPGIARDISHQSGWDIGRTSLKLRNPGNAPDEWELAVLKQFEERKMAGEDPATIDHAEITESDGQRRFRYMKAIPTGEVCLKCHGETLPPEVADKLDMLYPEDRARGFSKGDIRGAFTLSKPM